MITVPHHIYYRAVSLIEEAVAANPEMIKSKTGFKDLMAICMKDEGVLKGGKKGTKSMIPVLVKKAMKGENITPGMCCCLLLYCLLLLQLLLY